MKRRVVCGGAVAALGLLAGLVVVAGDGQRKRAKPSGPLALRTLDFPKARDAKRGRPVPLKVHYPLEGGRLPLVVFSHGGAGTRDAFLYQARDLASHGYVAVCVEHVFSNAARVKALARAATGTLKQRFRRALLQITTDPKAVLERPRDVSFAIDQAEAWNRTHPQLKGRIDLTQVAVVGHSFGAYTTQVVCGARPILDYLEPPLAPGKGLARDLSDPRVKVGVAFSPSGPGTSRFSKESFKTVKRPMLYFSGSLDAQFGHDGSTQAAKRRLKAYELSPPGDKYMAWLEAADHMAFADNPKAYLFPSRARPDTQRLCKKLTLAFCDGYLKNDAKAKKRLSAEYANSLCGDVVTKVRWLQK